MPIVKGIDYHPNRQGFLFGRSWLYPVETPGAIRGQLGTQMAWPSLSYFLATVGYNMKLGIILPYSRPKPFFLSEEGILLVFGAGFGLHVNGRSL